MHDLKVFLIFPFHNYGRTNLNKGYKIQKMQNRHYFQMVQSGHTHRFLQPIENITHGLDDKLPGSSGYNLKLCCHNKVTCRHSCNDNYNNKLQNRFE